VAALQDGIEGLRRAYAPASRGSSAAFVATIALEQSEFAFDDGPCRKDAALADAYRWIYWSGKTIDRADVAVVTVELSSESGPERVFTLFMFWKDGAWVMPGTPAHEQLRMLEHILLNRPTTRLATTAPTRPLH
jgi:hypothetical protein